MTDTSRSGGPGWYADPAGAPAARWWDGTRWTAETAPLPPLAPGSPGAVPDPAPEAVPDGPAAPRRAGDRLGAKVLLGLIGLVLAVVAGAMALAGGGGDAGQAGPTDPPRTSPSTAPVSRAATTAPPAQASTVPIAPPDDGPDPGSRENMAAPGQVIRLFDTDDGNYDVAIEGFWADAGPAVAAEDPLNQPAPVGFRYALVKLAATYHAGQQKRTGSVASNLEVALFGASGAQVADQGCGVDVPDSLDPLVELADGGVTVGNFCFLLPDAEAAGPVVVRVAEAFCFANCDAAWFRVQ